MNLVSTRLSLSPDSDIVPDGVEFHRQMVRRRGPLLAIAISCTIGLLAALLLWDSTSALRGVPGFILWVLAVPTSSLFGIPVMGGELRWILAVLSSLVLWFYVGHLAAQRSTRRVATSWLEWRREWTRLVIGIWAGSLLGLGLAATVLSVSL
ncbi:MAG: hypothetical protein RL688_326 [Actinomycetota bacterium]